MSAGPAAQTPMPPLGASPPSSASRTLTPVRALIRYVSGLLFFVLAEAVAVRAAHGLASEDWRPLVSSAIFLFLLVLGYAGLGFALNGQQNPIAQQGLAARRGWPGEMALGLAIGWGIAVACLLPMIFFRGIAIHFSFEFSAFGWLLAEAAYIALFTLAAQVAFRGYTFQMAIRAFGEIPATLLMAVVYAVVVGWLPGTFFVCMAENIVLALLLSMAYLRTRGLWLPWGLQMGWVASRALLFGLPVHGLTSHETVIQGYPLAESAFWGADFGLDGSWLAFIVLLLAMPFLYRATRDLSFEYNAPVLEPAGIPVDLDAASRRQHEAATRPDVPEAKPLVQILPVASPPPLAPDLESPRNAEGIQNPALDAITGPGPFPER